MADGQPISILTVCSRNRTRSILMAELLRRHVEALATRSDIAEVVITSAGTAAEALAPIAGVSQQLQRFGISMSPHVGRQVTDELVESADLILVADAEQVVWIAGRWAPAFAHTFTLSEVVEYLDEVGPRSGRTMAEWTLELAARRPRPQTYMTPEGVPGLKDPTGAPEDVWARITNEIDTLMARVARSVLS